MPVNTRTQTIRADVQDRRTAAAFAVASTTDETLAVMVRDSLRALARHSEPYARRLESCPGTRLAGQITAGLATPTPNGRAALTLAYGKAYAALAIPPGLDGNEFIDVLTGRRNPRLDRVPTVTTEADADREDRKL